MIRTPDLWVMSPARYRTALPRSDSVLFTNHLLKLQTLAGFAAPGATGAIPLEKERAIPENVYLGAILWELFDWWPSPTSLSTPGPFGTWQSEMLFRGSWPPAIVPLEPGTK